MADSTGMHQQPTHRPVSNRDGEHAVSLIEVLVVMLIVAVISAFAVPSLMSSRGSGGRVELRAAAARYSDAVERYQADHGRKVPVYGSADWRIPNQGPIKRLQIGGTVERPYLDKSIPEVMTRTGPAGAKWASRPPGSSVRGGRLVYLRTGSFSYRIDAYWDGKLLCRMGDVPAGAKTC